MGGNPGNCPGHRGNSLPVTLPAGGDAGTARKGALTMKTSDAVQTAVRFEARIWRAATIGTHEVRDEATGEYHDEPTSYPAEWAVYGVKSGARVKYCSTNQAAAEAYAAKWNSGKVPADVDAKDDSAVYLKTILHPGDEVKTILRSCSRSGMSRRISLVVAVDGDVQDITFHAAHAMGENIKQGGHYVQNGGLVVSGCGMDMGFHVIYNLSRTLFPDGFGVEMKIKDAMRPSPMRPVSRAAAAKMTEIGYRAYGRNGDKTGWDDDGGYALKQRWL